MSTKREAAARRAAAPIFTSYERFVHPVLNPSFNTDDLPLVPKELRTRSGLSWRLPHAEPNPAEDVDSLLKQARRKVNMDDLNPLIEGSLEAERLVSSSTKGLKSTTSHSEGTREVPEGVSRGISGTPTERQKLRRKPKFGPLELFYLKENPYMDHRNIFSPMITRSNSMQSLRTRSNIA